MKKYVTATLFIFWAIVTALLIAGLLFYQKGGNSTATVPTAVNQAGVAVTLSTAELVKHNSSADCWLLINGKVYNVTNYLYYHPGGVGMITTYCGADATTAFETKGGRSAHSGYAYSLLGNYLLGSLGQQTTISQINQVQQPGQAGSLTLPLGGREFED
jgi:hypothetical protein